MAQQVKVGVLVGSLSKTSYNRQVAEEMVRQAPGHMTFEFIEIGDLPLYTPDLEADVPASWQRFRDHVRRVDALLFVTAEYNRSMPAVLKNAIDVGSRPYGHNVWGKKPGAVASASIGAIGGFGANHHLRQSLVFVDVLAMAQPECYLSHVDKMLDDKGQFHDGTKKFLASFVAAFDAWTAKILA